LAEVDGYGNFHDSWEKVMWSNCYNSENKLIGYKWNNTILHIPFNYEKKLINRYGDNWYIPQNTKGIYPKKILI